MTIVENDFRLIPVGDDSIRFDLELLYTIKPKGKEERSEFKNVAYGVCLDHAVKLIANYRVNKRHKDEAITLITYFKEFTEELKSLKILCGI